MEVYNIANVLAMEIQNSEEYLKYKELKENIKKNSYLSEQINEFEKNRYISQVSQMNGYEEKAKEKELEEMYVELIKNEQIKEYFEREVKFNMLLADINKIIAESVKDVL